MLVDHYAILGILPSASVAEIKSAYRKLVLECHPDLHPHDPGATDRFQALQTAYETLTRPGLRQVYLEKRWYAQHRNQKMQSKSLDLEQLLKQFLELERFVATLDPHRMDRAGLQQHLSQLIDCLNQVNVDPTAQELEIKQTIRLTMATAEPLSYAQTTIIHDQLKNWLQKWNCTEWLENAWLIKKKSRESLQRWTPWIVLTLTFLISLWIWKSAQ